MTHRILSGTLSVVTLIALTILFFWKILLTNLILVGVDTFLYFYPYKAYAAQVLQQGRLPLWNPYLFMGAPLLANSQVGLFYPLNWPFIWFDAPKQVAWSIGLHISLAGILMYAFARQSLHISWAGAMVAAILFAFGGYLGAQAEHINQLNAAAWLPLIFLLYDLALARPTQHWFWLLWLAVIVALTLLAGHAQTVFVSLFGLGLYGLWRGISEPTRYADWRLLANYRRWIGHQSPIRPFASSLIRHLGPLVIISTLAVALAAVQLISTAELSALSIRRGGLSFREAVAFSLPPTALPYALLPPFRLDLSKVLGEAFGEWVAYLGISGLILALLGGLRSIWQREIRRFVFVAGSGLVLGLGLYSGPLYLALYILVPGFNLFRVPARWLLLYAFGAAVLAGFGFDALLTPSTLRTQLTSILGWLRARWWRGVLFIGIPLAGLLALLAWKTPPIVTVIAWLSCMATVVGILLYYLLRAPLISHDTQRATPGRLELVSEKKVVAVAFIPLLIAELFFAAQSLNYSHPTAPQAYQSMRNAIAFLLAADPPVRNQSEPPGRFLSLSGITYDPGDLGELKQVYGDQLSAKALYDLIVASKEKEVLFFNLPMLYGLHSVDGYDGGVLPLAQFVDLQKLFLPSGSLSIDGRLRENLRVVPPGKLLSLLNTRWIVTDKVFDVWIDDVFYDLQFPARLTTGKTISSADMPTFPATAIGLVSHLEGAAGIPAGVPVAQVTITFADKTSNLFILKAGIETAEGRYPPDAAHRQATIGVAWPYDAQGVDYIAVFPLANHDHQITSISLTASLPKGQFVLRGLSLINQPTTTSRSVILSTEGNYHQVHSGDVKIYENLSVLPRAFVVHQVEVVPDEATVIATMQSPLFDPTEKLVRLPSNSEQVGVITAGQSFAQDKVTITSYKPERVEVTARLASPGWLVLTDTYYPGWLATLDSRPVEIFRANLTFRAVAVPEGEHTIIFEFKPRSLRTGMMITGVTLVVLFVAFAVTRPGRKSTNDDIDWDQSKP